jgi:hypothetical protein
MQSDYLVQGSWTDPVVIPLNQQGQPLDPKVLDVMKSFERHNYNYYPFDFKDNWLENKNYLAKFLKRSGIFLFLFHQNFYFLCKIFNII